MNFIEKAFSLHVAGNPLASLSSELAQTNKMTQEQLDQWKAKLQSTLEAARKFESGNEDMTAWISAMQRRLDHEEGVRATVDGVQKQLEDAKVLCWVDMLGLPNHLKSVLVVSSFRNLKSLSQ